MRILIVNSFFFLKTGADKIAYETYKILKQQGHEVFFWAMDKGPYFEADYEYSKYFTPYYFGVKDYLKNPIKYYYNYRALRDLNKFIDVIEPDIIHYHSFWCISTLVFKANPNIPKVLTHHDARCCPMITLMYKNKTFCNKMYCKNGNFWPCIVNRCGKNNNIEESIRKALATYIIVKHQKYIDKFVVPSKALKEKLIEGNIGINQDNTIVVNNSLSSDELNKEPNYNNKDYFLYLGRLSKEKGLLYLLQALNDLPRDIRLYIAGAGKEEETLKTYVNEHNLNVKFLGFVKGEQASELYKNCIATILPSNCFDNFPTANLESFANGKPVIASNVGGIPEQVDDNENGLLFEAGNVEQLKECILKYWNNPELTILHGKNAYKKAIFHYSPKRYYNELMNVYEAVINERK